MSAVIAIAMLALLGVLWMRGERKAVDHLRAWAEDNGYRLLSVQRRFVSLTWFWHSRVQRVFDIVVEDETGARRSGKALVGDFLIGAWSNAVKVRWRD